VQQQVYYSNGKLLLSGEYLVLQGAKALAIPLKLGQDLRISTALENSTNSLSWNSYENNKLWFQLELSIKDFSIQKTSDRKIADQLISYLQVAKELNPEFLSGNSNLKIQTNLNFNRNWGLGSSSTLINNIANWAKVDAYQLSDLSTEGSAYDIACASSEQSIFYQLTGKKRNIENANFDPPFKDHLYFVYLGKKQNSANSVSEFKKLEKPSSKLINEISELGNLMASTNNSNDFNNCIKTHETLISSILKTEPIKQKHFSNFNGEIKSLGAWGGDFILVSSQMEFSKVKDYFYQLGLKTIFKYSELSK
jgi:mevalonate kinase